MNKQKITEFFDRLSHSWDSMLTPDENKMNEILNAANVKDGVSILDIACGTGVMFDYYLKHNPKKITGIDISPGMLKEAERKYSDNEKITLLCADAEEYSFSEKYDCCVIFNAFPHFPNPEKLIKNLSVSLNGGGTLTVAHDRGRKAIDAHHTAEANEVSRGLMSETDLAEMLRSLGFKNICTRTDDTIYIVSAKKQ